MSPRRRFSAEGTPTPSEEPRQAISAELRELRALVTNLVARSFRQDQRLEQLFPQRGGLVDGKKAGAAEQRLERKRPAPNVNRQPVLGDDHGFVTGGFAVGDIIHLIPVF